MRKRTYISYGDINTEQRLQDKPVKKFYIASYYDYSKISGWITILLKVSDDRQRLVEWLAEQKTTPKLVAEKEVRSYVDRGEAVTIIREYDGL